MSHDIEDARRILAEVEAMKADGADETTIAAWLAETKSDSQDRLAKEMREVWEQYEPVYTERAALKEERDKVKARYQDFYTNQYLPARRALSIRVSELREQGLATRTIGAVTGIADGSVTAIEKVGREFRTQDQQASSQTSAQ